MKKTSTFKNVMVISLIVGAAGQGFAQNPNNADYGKQISNIRTQLENLRDCDNLGEEWTVGITLSAVAASAIYTKYAKLYSNSVYQQLQAVRALNKSLDGVGGNLIISQLKETKVNTIRESLELLKRESIVSYRETIKAVFVAEGIEIADTKIDTWLNNHEQGTHQQPEIRDLLKKNPVYESGLIATRRGYAQAQSIIRNVESDLAGFQQEFQVHSDKHVTSLERIRRVLNQHETALKKAGANIPDFASHEQDAVQIAKIANSTSSLNNALSKSAKVFTFKRIAAWGIPSFMLLYMMNEDYRHDLDMFGGTRYDRKKLRDLGDDELQDLARDALQKVNNNYDAVYDGLEYLLTQRKCN